MYISIATISKIEAIVPELIDFCGEMSVLGYVGSDMGVR
ncbi:MAG: hypothetical protein ACI9Y1_002215 [Lentisphaeria bacterium]|jgi:hypothetical protein